MNRFRLGALLCLSLLSGCASTRVDITGNPLDGPLCHAGQPPVPIHVVWGAQWRIDQKEPALRLEAAEQGLNDFLGKTGCLSVLSLSRMDRGAASGANPELKHLPSNTAPAKLVVIRVRELGPRLEIGIPVIVEGGTEVLLDVQVFEVPGGAQLASSQTLWRHGGKFVIKGVKTLQQDMSAALSATLLPGQSSP